MPAIPAAPVLFSTTTGWPKERDRYSPSKRAVTSVEPPATTGTMMRTGLAGQSSARLGAAAPAKSSMTAQNLIVGIVPPSRRLLDHLVGAHEDRRRNRDVKRSRRLQVPGQDEARRLLDRQIGRARALEDRVSKRGGAAVTLVEVGTVGHHSAVLRLGHEGVDRRKMACKRQRCDLSPASEHHIVGHEYDGLC